MLISPGADMKTPINANGAAHSAISRCRDGIRTTSTTKASATEMVADRDTEVGDCEPDQHHRRPPLECGPLGVVDRKVDRQRQQHPGYDSELDRRDSRAGDPVQVCPGDDRRVVEVESRTPAERAGTARGPG